MKNERSAILRRFRDLHTGWLMRELDCGHAVPEPSGGRAKYATTANCLVCTAAQNVTRNPAPASAEGAAPEAARP